MFKVSFRQGLPSEQLIPTVGYGTCSVDATSEASPDSVFGISSDEADWLIPTAIDGTDGFSIVYSRHEPGDVSSAVLARSFAPQQVSQMRAASFDDVVISIRFNRCEFSSVV